MASSRHHIAPIPNELVCPFPVRMQQAIFINFFYRADHLRLQAVCNQWFNHATNHQFLVEPAFPFVVVSFALYPSAVALPWQDKWGHIPYLEQLFILIVKRKDKSVFDPGNYYAFVPYLFLNHSLPTVAGREIIGMPKILSNIQIPPYPSTSGGHFSTATTVLPEYGNPESTAKVETLIDITCSQQFNMAQLWQKINLPQKLSSSSPFPSLQHPIGLFEEIAGLNKSGFDRLIEFYKSRFISLRQFRDMRAPGMAVHKAVVEFYSTQIKVWDSGLLDGQFLTTFPSQNASFPIQQDLGMEEECLFANWMKLDFKFQTSGYLWQAGKPMPASNLMPFSGK